MDVKNKIRLWNIGVAIAIDIAFSKMHIGLGLAFIPIWIAGLLTISFIHGIEEEKKHNEETKNLIEEDLEE